MVFLGGAFGRCLGLEDRALMNGIRVLIKDSGRLPCPSHRVRTWGQDSHLGSWIIEWGLPASRNVRNALGPALCGGLLPQLEQTETA